MALKKQQEGGAHPERRPKKIPNGFFTSGMYKASGEKRLGMEGIKERCAGDTRKRRTEIVHSLTTHSKKAKTLIKRDHGGKMGRETIVMKGEMEPKHYMVQFGGKNIALKTVSRREKQEGFD